MDARTTIADLERRLAAAEAALSEKAGIEADLRRSEELRRIAVEGGRMGTWRSNLREQVISGDAAFMGVWGFPPTEGPRPYAQFLERMSPQGRELMAEMIAGTPTAGEVFDGEHAVVGGPNAGRWVRWRGRSEREHPWIVNGVCFDVTDQRRSEERLRESEARHRLLIESWAQAVWETDPAGVVVADSPSWRAYTGQTLDEWLGYGWLDAIHPDDRAYAERQWREAVAARGLVNAEFRLRAPDGGWRWTNVRAAPVLDAGGNIEKWAGLNVDIDARKRAETALRTSEQKFRKLFDSIEEGFAIQEMIYNDAGVIVDIIYREVNKSFERQGGVKNAVDRSIYDVIPGVEDHWLTPYKEVAKTGQAQRIENYQQDVDRWFDVYFINLDKDGRFIATVFNDITDRKRAEIVLRESEERQTFLLKLSDLIRPMRDAMEIQRAAVQRLCEHLNVSRSGYYEVEADQNTFFLTARWEQEAVPLPDRMLLSDFGEDIREGYRAGRTMVARDTEQDAASEDNLAAVRAIRVRAWIGVPLVKDGRWVAAVGVHSAVARDWTPSEIQLVEEVGERTWAAVERARTESALRESEERYHALFTASPVPFMVLAANAPDFTILAANEAYHAATLTTPETLIGRRLFDVFTDDPRRPGQLGSEALDISLERVLRTRETDAMERVRYDIVTPEGGFEEHWWLAINAPLLDAAGNVTTIIHQVDRQTELHFAEVALRGSEERFRQFASSSTNVLWIRDAKTWAFEYVSPAVQTVYGVSPEAVLANARLLNALIVPEERDRVSGNLKRVGDGEVVVQEYRIQRPTDLAFRWMRSTGFPLHDAKGRVERIGAIAQDITDEKLAVEHQAVLLAELQHRVRNIMALVRSITARTGERAESVEAYTELMLGRLLAFARVQALLTRAANARVGIATIVRDEVSVQAQHEGQYVLDGPDIALSPKAAEVLTLAIHELATNAVKYGALSVPTGTVAVVWSIVEKRGGPWLSFDWTEEGAPERPEPSSGAPRRRGFGSELIEGRVPYELKGRATIAIETGGARCHLEFPLKEGASILETGAPQRATVFGGALDMTGEPDLSGHRVLVVEDDYFLASDAARALRGAGAEVMGPCPTEEDAHAELMDLQPTAVMLDINLGSGASFKLAEQLKDARIPFVFVTGYDQEVIPAEFDGVERLQKPVQLREVVAAISRLTTEAA